MKKLIFGLLVIGFTCQLFSQVETLPEIEIKVLNYKYLNSVDSKDLDSDVKILEKEVAYFDVLNSDFYRDDWVMFYIPKGKILASYDGNVNMTIEKFENIKLPPNVSYAIFKRFPGWYLKKNVYKVTYYQESSRKEYRVVIQNGDQVLRLRTDEKGNFYGEENY
jgi:hypothetical protein